MLQSLRPRLRFLGLYLRYAVVRVLSPLLIRWKPLRRTESGYTILLGCHGELAPIALANLRLLERQRRENLHRIVLIFDRPRRALATDIQRQCENRFPHLPLAFRYYSPLQRRIAQFFASGWVYAWLSWCIGIAATDTRYAFLHDFDLLLLDPSFFEHRYRTIQERQVQYLGIQAYTYNGFTDADKLVATIELGFDAAFIRGRFKPRHLYNYVGLRRGQPLDYDTLLYAQSCAGRTAVVPIKFGQLVHPAQMICQYTHWRRWGSSANVTQVTRLVLIPYYLHLAGRPASLAQVTAVLKRAGLRRHSCIELLGGAVDLQLLTAELVRIFCLDISLVEKALYGHTRLEVQRFIAALRTFSGEHEVFLAA